MDINKFTIFNEDIAGDFSNIRVKAVGEKWGDHAVGHESFNGYAVGFEDAENIYKTLLFKYMKIVCDAEGVSYLSKPDQVKNLTPVELKILQSIAGMV